MSRSSCPRSLEKKLNREVHYYCPLCGGIPLVRAHTIKTYKDVGWDPNYLLSICGECENNVEKNIIPRTRLHEIKQKLRLTIPQEDRTKPYQINLLNTQTVFIGNNVFYTANIIFSYKRLPILWFSVKDNIRVLNARFYSKDGMVVSAIDENQWTADRIKFFDFESKSNNKNKILSIISRKDDTNIQLMFSPEGIYIQESIFYIPGSKIEILSDGSLRINMMTFSSSVFYGSDNTIFSF